MVIAIVKRLVALFQGFGKPIEIIVDGGYGIEHVVFLFDGVVDVGQEFFGMSGSSSISCGSP